MRYPLLYELPIWVIGVLLVVALLGALEIGYRVGRWKGPAWKEFDSGRGGGVVLTSMFALLGLMLAFTYAFTVTRFDARKQAIVDEANAISTRFSGPTWDRSRHGPNCGHCFWSMPRHALPRAARPAPSCKAC
jgi:hypothetical protein